MSAESGNSKFFEYAGKRLAVLGVMASDEATRALGFTERQFRLIMRFWKWEAVILIYSFVSALSIGYIVPGMLAMQGDGAKGVIMEPAAVNGMILYLLVGSLMWGFLSVVFDEVSNTITWERWEGTIEHTFMAPVRRGTHLFGVILFAVLFSLLKTGAVLFLVSMFFDLDMGRANLAGAVMVLLVSSLAFAGLGILVAVLPLLSPEKGSQVSRIIQALLLMVSGIYYPITVLPAWMQTLAVFSPATYSLQGIRMALLEGVPTAGLYPSLWTLTLFAVVLNPVGFLVFSAGEAYAKRKGLLKRNG